MPTLQNVPTTLPALTAVVNARQSRSLLTETNFEVLEVMPYKDARSGFNTMVKIRLDLFPDTVIPVVDTDRYSIRYVPATRIPFKDAIANAALPTNELGHVLVTDPSTLTAVLTELAPLIAIDPLEVTFAVVNETTSVIQARGDSLGFLGGFTVITAPPAQQA